ncbi:DNA polymerase III subunit gamma and tau [Tessaracoccus sp. SD287]|uniref:DNA polymerase III subunit gamma and tau n=1 Tax=Tessaracoccus sp. SD287 TaxID=2782008 RepID=UPI001A957AEB|nr:DNA polymerase III subunit gamma and tau [Tessaracoccus sp. SD287]MBO1029989.1 DNA polymerase III subunit gamma and tau [Tessaracoccus sp. SD287]
MPDEQDGPSLFEDEPEPVTPEPVAVEPGHDAGVAETAVEEPVVAPRADLAPPPAQDRPERPRDELAAPLALYRRYRPDTFDEVIGQEHVTEPLMRALVNNKVNHAYLFSGPRGCGKTTSARILARSLNCAQGPTPTPCGECRSCRDLARGGPGSIDVIEMDAASNGGVEDARDLRERAFFAPVQSRYKIYIIDEAHMVTSAGFNALLKLVEEPPPHVKFIFATTEPEKVIGTIRSRTHHYPFRLVPPKVLVNHLQNLCMSEGVQVEAEVLPLVVRAGAGSVRDSLSVLDQLLGAAGAHGVEYVAAAALLGYTPDTLLDEVVDAFAAGDGKGVFATIDKVIEVGQDPRRFAEDLLRRLRDLVIVAAVPDAVETGLIDVSGDQAERLSLQAAAIGSGELTRAAEVIAAGLTEMRGTTAPRLHLELMCARVLLPGADVDERGVHARLDRLERRLAEGGVPVDHASPAAPPAPREEWSDADRGPGAQSPSPAQAPQGRQSPVSSADHAPASTPPPVHTPAARQQPPATQQQPPAAPQQQRPPAEQRPSGPRQRPHREPAAEQQRPDNVVPLRPQSASPTVRPGDIDTARMRQEWPRVLEEVKGRRKFSFILLSQNAQVGDVTDGLLTLVFANPGARDNFTSGGTNDVLRDSIIEVLGADLKIKPVLDESRGAGSPQARGPVGRPGRDRADRAGGPQAHPADPPPSHDEEPPPPDEEPEPDTDRRGFGELAKASVRPTTTAGQVSAETPEVDAGESADDQVLDESGSSAAELLMSELGGEIIDERER